MRISDWSSDVCSSDLADRDLYQAFVAERSLLDSDAGEHVQALKASHAENLKQAYDRVQKYAAMQPGAEALALVEQFNGGFQQWSAVSQRVIEQVDLRSEEHTSELQSLMLTSFAVFCLK